MRFRATIQLDGKTATGIRVPEEVAEGLGGGNRPPVRVTVNGHAYHTTVAPVHGEFKIPVSAGSQCRWISRRPWTASRTTGAPSPGFPAAITAARGPDRADQDGRDAATAHRQGARRALRGPSLRPGQRTSIWCILMVYIMRRFAWTQPNFSEAGAAKR